MKEITVRVQENEYDFLLHLLAKLDFVTVLENKKAKKELQKKIITERLISSFTQAKLIEEGKLEGRLVEEFLAELEAEEQA